MAAPAVVVVPVVVPVAVEADLVAAVPVAAVELHPPWPGLASHGRPPPRPPLP
jgi:hypothetical protein